MTRRASIASALLAGCAAFAARAEAPKVDSLFPAGGQRGSEFDVTANGKLDSWPVQAVCDRSGIEFVPGEMKGTYRVTIAADAEPGPCLVRFINADGAAAPRQFVIGESPERAESDLAETTFSPSDFPLTVNGKLASGGEVDRFAIELDAGERCVAAVTAYALDSPLDPLLHLRGPGGEQLAFNHDATRNGLDPRLVFEAPAAGRYELHLSAFAYPPRADIRFTGGADCVYRLALTSEPPALDLPPPHEQESEGPQPIEVPSAVSGAIDPPGDVDCFQFSVAEGDTFRLEIAAAALGSWMDPVLVIKDKDGKELKRHDDIDRKTNHDVALDWTAPAEGEFIAEVRDLNGAGGRGIAYRFEISKPAPSIAAATPGGVYSIVPGKTAEIPVKVARQHGFKGELEVGAADLPAGLTAAPVAVSEKGEAKLVLEAAADAPPANAAIAIWAGLKGDENSRVPCRFELKGDNAEAGGLLVNHTGRGWLTVLEKKD